MARKKPLSTIRQLTEEGNGALTPEKEDSSDTQTESAETSKHSKKRRIVKRTSESFKKTLGNILAMRILPETVAEAVKSTPLGDNITYQEAILIAQVLKAACGDTQAAVFLRDTTGNKHKGGEERLPSLGEIMCREDFPLDE